MSKIDNSVPEILRIRSSRSCLLIVLGCPFLLAGLFILARTFDIIHANSKVDLIVGVPAGLFFFLIGLTMLCLKRGATLDLSNDTATAWISMLVPFVRRTCKLSGTKSVTLEKVVRSQTGTSNVSTCFCVHLDGEYDVLMVGKAQMYEDARRIAESVADFMDVVLIDKSSGRAVKRQPGTLDQSPREQAQDKSQPQKIPEPPSNLKSIIEHQGDTLTIAVPIVSNLFSKNVISLMPGAIIWCGFITWKLLMPLFYNTTMAALPKVLLLSFFGLMGVVLPIAAIIILFAKARAGWTRFIVSPEMIRIKEHGTLMTKQMKSQEVEEVIFEGYNIMMRSDAKTYSIALRSNINAAERRYIKALIETVITA
jgi:hypothetical protein